MGYSASTQIIYGLKINKSQLEEIHESCHHKFNIKNAKFCPECGTPVSKNLNMGAHETVEVWVNDYRMPEDIGHKFNFQFSQPNYDYSEGIVGFKFRSSSLIQEVFTPTQSMTETILAFAESHGIKASYQDIKMYSILEESY